MLQLTQSKMLQNQYLIKQYNDDTYKLILFKTNIKNSGYEEMREPQFIPDDPEEFQKHECNISRTRSKIWEYATCNEFEYFITLTLDKEKMDRYDLQNFISKLGQFIRNNRNRKNSNIEYLLIPEQHKDGAYHMHGLIRGINKRELKAFTLEDKIPFKIKNLIRAGRTIYNWKPYEKKFGWVTLEEIQNKEAVAKYITKYIKKDIGVTVTEKNRKSYYCSKGLKQAENIKKGTFPTAIRNVLNFDFENEFLMILNLNKQDLENIIHKL